MWPFCVCICKKNHHCVATPPPPPKSRRIVWPFLCICMSKKPSLGGRVYDKKTIIVWPPPPPHQNRLNNDF